MPAQKSDLLQVLSCRQSWHLIASKLERVGLSSWNQPEHELSSGALRTAFAKSLGMSFAQLYQAGGAGRFRGFRAGMPRGRRSGGRSCATSIEFHLAASCLISVTAQISLRRLRAQ